MPKNSVLMLQKPKREELQFSLLSSISANHGIKTILKSLKTVQNQLTILGVFLS